MAGDKKFLRNLLFFTEPDKIDEFILEEKQEKNQENKSQAEDKEEAFKKQDRLARKKAEVSKNLSENLDYIKKKYSIPTNGDIVLREFDVVVKNKAIAAFIVFFDGMVDRKVVNDNILQPLMLLSNLEIKGDEKQISDYVREHLLPHNQIQELTELTKIIEEVNFGGCGIFIDGMETAFAADVKGWEHRNVSRPNTELVIRGPQEGFTEVLRVNTALVRKIVKDEALIVENVEIGRRSKTACSLLYIKDIANDSLVNEMRRRLTNIKVDFIVDSGELEQLIEDNSILPPPQMISTERPDRIATMLAEGKVAVILNGSPFALAAPATLSSLIHSQEDLYIRFPYVNMLRIIRILGILLSLLLPGLYIAITNFHQEMIPTDLLFAIEAARERVPFPSIVEILIMEISFELIREAGIRIPGPIGPTLGIIGALILGQAAVAASIISPILIIVVAVTGIGSFAIPNFSLGLAFRLLRFVYIFLGGMAGLLGITLGMFVQGMFLVNSKSFGVAFTAPFSPKTYGVWNNDLTRAPIWKQEKRADFLNTKNEKKQPKISRTWIKNKQDGDKNGK